MASGKASSVPTALPALVLIQHPPIQPDERAIFYCSTVKVSVQAGWPLKFIVTRYSPVGMPP